MPQSGSASQKARRSIILAFIVGPVGCADLLGADFDGWLGEHPPSVDSGATIDGGNEGAAPAPEPDAMRDTEGGNTDAMRETEGGNSGEAGAVELVGSFAPEARARAGDGTTLEGRFVWQTVNGTTSENIELRGWFR
jgi:hypothetical protein